MVNYADSDIFSVGKVRNGIVWGLGEKRYVKAGQTVVVSISRRQ